MKIIPLYSSADRTPFWRWTVMSSLGTFVGMGSAVVIALFIRKLLGEHTSGLLYSLQVAGFLLAGAIGGLFNGYFQWRALRPQFLDIRAIRWILKTIIASAIIIAMAMLPSFFIHIPKGVVLSVSPLKMFLAGALLGIIPGLIYGFAQWTELKKYAQGASNWLAGNAWAWMAAISIMLAASCLEQGDTPSYMIIVYAAAAGLLSSVAMGLITGLFLRKMHSQNDFVYWN